MDLKFYLNKFVKCDNIEGYTLKSLFKLKDIYSDFLENSGGIDPDFPEINFGEATGGKTVGGTNKAKIDGFQESDDQSNIL